MSSSPNSGPTGPDLGIINGVHSLIAHFEGTSIPDTTAPVYSAPQEVGIQPVINTNNLKIAGGLLLIGMIGTLSILGLMRWSRVKENKSRLDDLTKLLDGMVDREAAGLEALKELKAQFVLAVWKDTEESFNLVDRQKLELDLLEAKRAVRSGVLSANDAGSQIDDLEITFKKALNDIDGPVHKLAEVRNAQQECPRILAGLDAAFQDAEKEMRGDQIAMVTRMKLAEARHAYEEASSIAKLPPGMVDWVILLNNLEKVREAVEHVSKDAARDREIAEKIQDQDPDELLSRMKKILDEAEERRVSVDKRIYELGDAWDEYFRAQNYRSENLNSTDLYLLMSSIELIIERHHMQAVERASEEVQETERAKEAREHENATSVHHEGFGSSGSDRFGGGPMGGGSRGGGKW